VALPARVESKSGVKKRVLMSKGLSPVDTVFTEMVNACITKVVSGEIDWFYVRVPAYGRAQ